MHHFVVGVARHVEHLHVGPERAKSLGELPSAHPGHHHVGQEKVDGRSVLLAQ